MSQDDGIDRLTLSSAAANADWDRLELASSVAGPKFNLNLDASAAAGTHLPTANAYVNVVSGIDTMGAGEFLDLCGRDAGNTANLAVNNAKITLRDVTANQIMGEWTFSQIGACA